ncbi:MAG: hypothetical protein M0Z59_03160 [Nitrospiraceae bacterium]|nr:hypothetical protein [Nitrospiraceae bacterium]
MKSCYQNILETSAVTLSSGAADLSYPLYRLWDRDIGRPFKAADTGTLEIKIDQGAAPLAIDRLIIPAGHNLSGARLKVSGSDDDITYRTLLDASLPDNSLINRELAAADDFNNSSLDANLWGLLLGGGAGAVASETTSLDLKTAQAAEYSAICLKTAFARAAGQSPQTITNTLGVGANALYSLSLVRSAALPSAAFDSWAQRVVLTRVTSAGNLQFVYYGANGTTYYFNGASGQWGTPMNDAYTAALNRRLRIRLENSGSAWRLTLRDNSNADALLRQTPWVGWADTYADGTPEWLIAGDPSNSFNFGEMNVYLFDTGLSAPATKRYMKVAVTASPATPQMPELFLSPTYIWEKLPARPAGPLEDVFNVEAQTATSGRDHFLVHGSPKRQRVYHVTNAGSAQYASIKALWGAWGGAKPFWLCDHEGDWIFGKLSRPLNLKEEGSNKYSFDFEFLEVLP